VLIWASCYAGEVAGQPLDGERTYGRGVDGADWWEKFQGTVLGYRQSAPTRAAPAVTREFTRNVAALQVSPKDEHRYSQAVAGAWMRANAKREATFATAIDSQGNYYFMGPTAAPLPGAKVVARVRAPSGRIAIKAVPRSAWSGAVDLLRGRMQEETPLVQALEEATFAHRGGKPFDSADAFLAAPMVREHLQRQGFDPNDPAVRRTLDLKIRYDAHVYYESDAGMGLLVARLAFLAEREGRHVLSARRIQQELTPSAAAHQLGRDGRLTPWRPDQEQIRQILFLTEAQIEVNQGAVQ
jgi:hypothetical protein